MTAVRFSACMADALYGKNGYYIREGERIGRAGDFYTSALVSPVFGELWASFALAEFASGTHLAVAELGCGGGDFAEPFVRHLLRADPARSILYAAIDVAEPARRRTRERLLRIRPEFRDGEARLEVLAAATALEAAQLARGRLGDGFLFANELLDALPCDIVRCRGGAAEVLMVEEAAAAGAEEGAGLFAGRSRRTFFTAAGSGPWLAYARRYLLPLAGGEPLIAEAQTGLAPAVSEALSALRPRVAAFVDYGGRTVDIVGPDRPRGSLRAYRGHRLVDDFLDFPGACDLTYDVDFSALEDALRSAGYRPRLLERQGPFLVALPAFARLAQERMAARPNASLAIRQLVMPGAMGDRFLVSIAGRD